MINIKFYCVHNCGLYTIFSNFDGLRRYARFRSEDSNEGHKIISNIYHMNRRLQIK